MGSQIQLDCEFQSISLYRTESQSNCMEGVSLLVREKVLFICTHNSARSQMAEGFLRTLGGDKYEVYSAGIEPTSVNPHAIQVMGELGIDISRNRSKSMKEFLGMRFDYVVTVCDHAARLCEGLFSTLCFWLVWICSGHAPIRRLLRHYGFASRPSSIALTSIAWDSALARNLF